MAEEPNLLEENQPLDQRRDPPLREPRRSAGAGGRAWWWLWILIILLIIWFGGWGWGGYGGWWGWGSGHVAANTSHAVPANPNHTTLENVPAIVHSNKSTVTGDRVKLQNEKVQATAGNGAYWVGPDRNNRVLVVAPAIDVPREVKAGSTVMVTGTVQQMPSTQQAEQQWKLNPADAKQAGDQGIYVMAQQVTANPGE